MTMARYVRYVGSRRWRPLCYGEASFDTFDSLTASYHRHVQLSDFHGINALTAMISKISITP